MSEQLMIACDNPACDNIGSPGWIPGEDGARRKKGEVALAPYGWLQGSGLCVGRGPNYSYHSCSVACVGPAIAQAVRRAIAEGE